MDKEKKTSPKTLLQTTIRSFRLMWAWYPARIVGLIGIVIGVSVVTFLQSASQAFLVNELIGSANIKNFSPLFWWAASGFVAMLILPRILFSARSYFFRMLRYFTQEKADLLVLERKGEIDIAHWEDPKQHNLFLLVRENEYRLLNFFDRIFDAAEQLAQVAIAAVIIVAFKWWTLPIILVCAIPEFIVEKKYGRRVWGIWQGKVEVRRRFNSFEEHFSELSKIVELKLYQNVRHFLSVLGGLYRSFISDQVVNERRRFRYASGAFLLSNIGIVLVAIAFIGDVVHGVLQVGTFLFVVGAAREFRGSLSQFFSTLASQYQDSYFVSEIFRFLDLPPVLSKPTKPVALLKSSTPEIVFENVSFAYPGTKKLSLEHVSFCISPGEKVALVGRNGAGKTTIVKLLCRFYDPTEGRITVGGYDLKDVDLNTWYRLIAPLFQEYSNYRMGVGEAIAMGQTDLPQSPERVQAAARASEAAAFIERWDDGYRQALGKEFSGGMEPSIGQWQKLAIARVFYRDAQVVVLDEPTSSIDPEAEAAIFEKLAELSADKTVLLISHRFSTVRRAEKILVLDGGKLVEEGSHEKLLAQDGMYAHLFRLQAKGYA
ncbi:MAG: ABC transporter ATP-binding protein [bacterium]|nr:ABC transporter ATP-binding protein [bacterium]